MPQTRKRRLVLGHRVNASPEHSQQSSFDEYARTALDHASVNEVALSAMESFRGQASPLDRALNVH
jgi:hypothetical protein